jgi:hypothetical protein
MNQHFAVLPVGRPYGYFNVLPERGEKIHGAFDGKSPRVPSHERRHMRLLDAKDFACQRRGEATLLNKPVDAERKVRLKLLALGVRKSEVGEDIAKHSVFTNAA